jgi:hypothetical protein
MNKKAHKQRHHENSGHHKHHDISSSINTTEPQTENIMDQQLVPEVNKDIVQTNEPGEFHEGHYKDIPEQKDIISHEDFHEKKDIAEKHSLGEDVPQSGSEKEQGLWEKAKHLGTEVKDAILDGASKVKHLFTR